MSSNIKNCPCCGQPRPFPTEEGEWEVNEQPYCSDGNWMRVSVRKPLPDDRDGQDGLRLWHRGKMIWWPTGQWRKATNNDVQDSTHKDAHKDYNAMCDVLHEVYNKPHSESEIDAIVASLPKHIQDIGKEWTWSDTVFRDNVYEYLMELKNEKDKTKI